MAVLYELDCELEWLQAEARQAPVIKMHRLNPNNPMWGSLGWQRQRLEAEGDLVSQLINCRINHTRRGDDALIDGYRGFDVHVRGNPHLDNTIGKHHAARAGN